jgi:hypothetical protein
VCLHECHQVIHEWTLRGGIGRKRRGKRGEKDEKQELIDRNIEAKRERKRKTNQKKVRNIDRLTE